MTAVESMREGLILLALSISSPTPRSLLRKLDKIRESEEFHYWVDFDGNERN